MGGFAKNVVKERVQVLLARRGYRVVRWPVPVSTGASGDAAAIPRHFPVGHVRPWTVPDDLRSRQEPWARVLVGVYDDPASWPSSIVPEGGMLLHALVRNIQPRLIVETGTCLGVSTIWMGAALKLGGGGMIHTYDDYRAPPDERLAASALFRDRLAGVRARVDAAGLSEVVNIHNGESSPLVKRDHEAIRAAGGAQMAFIDADHSPQGTVADFMAIEPILAVGGYVIVHDVFPEVANHLGPRVLVDQIGRFAAGRYQACDVFTAQTNYGMTILQRVG